jgi:thioredoxin 1
MPNIKLIIVSALLAASVAGGLFAQCCVDCTPTEQPAASEAPAAASLPRLLDLGAGRCIPCKMMAPILEELKSEYAGRLEVVFIDVWENRLEGEKYGIRAIPTQIFFAPDGTELFRHQGFYSKEAILAKWAELGFALNSTPAK